MKKIATGFLAVVAASFGFAGPGTVRITEAYSVNPCVEGLTGDPYVLRTSEPWYAYPGYGVVLVVSRIGGSSGRIAVKYKTQTSTATLLKDFEYVKDVLVWEDGDDSDREIYIETYNPDYLTDYEWNLYAQGRYYPKQMRIKLSKMTKGLYEGCVNPHIPVEKNYIQLIGCETMPQGFVVPGVTPEPSAGTVKITGSYSVDCCSENVSRGSSRAPWVVNAGDVMRLRISRVNGSSGRIAVKYKTQTSTAICGTDFDYVKDVLVWEDGDDTDRYIDIPTSMFSTTGCGGFRPCNCVETPDGYLCTSCLDYYNCPRTLQMRIKFVKMATGQYYGCRVPVIENNKVYMTIDYGSTTR